MTFEGILSCLVIRRCFLFCHRKSIVYMEQLFKCMCSCNLVAAAFKGHLCNTAFISSGVWLGYEHQLCIYAICLLASSSLPWFQSSINILNMYFSFFLCLPINQMLYPLPPSPSLYIYDVMYDWYWKASKKNRLSGHLCLGCRCLCYKAHFTVNI